MSTPKGSGIALALGMGALGALLNLAPLPLGAGVDLVLGNVVYIVLAAWLRPALVFVAALIAVLPLYFAWGHLGGLVVFGCEALVVALLRERGTRLFYAAALYWLVLGMPLTAVLVHLVGSAPAADYVVAICAKQAFNGAVYGSLGAMIVLLAGPRVTAWLDIAPAAPLSLRSRLVYVMTLITAFTLATATLLSTRATLRYQERLISTSLAETATHLARRVDDYVGNHEHSIDMVAELLSRARDRAALTQPMLLEEHRRNPGFLTLLATDATGRIVASSPAERMEGVAAGVVPSVSDRPYFIEAMARDELFVSEVFQGRGFGSEPIVAISRAVRDGAQGPALGIVEGSLNLRELAAIAEPGIEGRAVQVLLLDRESRVIHASPGLGLEVLEPLERYRRAPGDAARDVLALDAQGRTVEYLYSSHALADGWHIYALMDYGIVIRDLNLRYGMIFLLMGFAIAVAAWLAARAAQRLAAPLERLAAELAGVEESGVAHIGPVDPDASLEVALVHRELKRSFEQIERHRVELETQVRLRTEELESANGLLQALASVDALTGIGNRRVLEERFPLLRAGARRNSSRIAMVLVDLDHFKRLNDTHGHLAGDQCLIEAGLLLAAEFARETDIVARFGGEEFAIAVECGEAAALGRKLEAVRDRIQCLRIAAGAAEPLRITASFGAVVAGAEYSAQLSDWIRVADQCLYRAKGAGRNQVVIDAIA